MRRLASVEELGAFRQRILSEKEQQYDRTTLVVCSGTGGQASGSNDIIRIIRFVLSFGVTGLSPLG